MNKIIRSIGPVVEIVGYITICMGFFSLFFLYDEDYSPYEINFYEILISFPHAIVWLGALFVFIGGKINPSIKIELSEKEELFDDFEIIFVDEDEKLSDIEKNVKPYNDKVIKLYLNGEYDKAIILANKVLKYTENKTSKRNYLIATFSNNLARLYQKKGEYSKAEKLFKRSLSMREDIFGKRNPKVIKTLENLIYFYKICGQNEKMQEIIKIRKQRIIKYEREQNKKIEIEKVYSENSFLESSYTTVIYFMLFFIFGLFYSNSEYSIEKLYKYWSMDGKKKEFYTDVNDFLKDRPIKYQPVRIQKAYLVSTNGKNILVVADKKIVDKKLKHLKESIGKRELLIKSLESSSISKLTFKTNWENYSFLNDSNEFKKIKSIFDDIKKDTVDILFLQYRLHKLRPIIEKVFDDFYKSEHERLNKKIGDIIYGNLNQSIQLMNYQYFREFSYTDVKLGRMEKYVDKIISSIEKEKKISGIVSKVVYKKGAVKEVEIDYSQSLYDPFMIHLMFFIALTLLIITVMSLLAVIKKHMYRRNT